MFALVGAILVILSAFGVHPDSVDLFQLGIGSFFLQFAFPIAFPFASGWTRREP